LTFIGAPEDHLLKDKSYRRYAAGVDRALSLFETALEEWADYISFLNKLLKVSSPKDLSPDDRILLMVDATRLFKLDQALRPRFLRKPSFPNDCRNVSTRPYPPAYTKRPWKYTIMSFLRLDTMD
jgi:hypothetical protein